MSEYLAEFEQLADALAKDGHAQPGRTPTLWQVLVDLDMTSVLSAGGFPAHLDLVRTLATRSLFSVITLDPVIRSQIEVPEHGPITAAASPPSAPSTATLQAPWAEPGGAVAVWDAGLPANGLTVAKVVSTSVVASNLEPFLGVKVDSGASLSVEAEVMTSLRARADLAVTALVLGAAEGAVDATLRHVVQREQFGVPLVRLGSVKNQLGLARVKVALARAALDRAARRIDSGTSPKGELDAAMSARVVVAEAATDTANIAHQLHGAVGMTREHHLGRFTRPLWAFRDWPTPAAEAARYLGLHVHGSRSLWDDLTTPDLERAI